MDVEQVEKRTSIDTRRAKFEQTSVTAAAAIDAERNARLEKTERLRAAREAAQHEAD